MRSVATMILLAACLACAGCASPEVAPAAAPQGSTTLSPAASALRDQLTGANNGLEIRRWIISDDPEAIMRAITAHADGLPIDEGKLGRLKANGLRLVRVPLVRLDQLLADLGGARYEANEWHGQVYDWRWLVERPIDEQGRAIAIDGLVRRYQRGDFRLMMRAWTLQMEDGAFLNLEVVARRRVPQVNSLRRLLGENPQDEISFASMAVGLRLQEEFAYLLMGESPQINWPLLDGSSNDATQAGTAGSARRSTSDLGPETEAPLTLGEFLMAADRYPQSRGVIVFVPRVGDQYFSPVHTAHTSMQKGNGL